MNKMIENKKLRLEVEIFLIRIKIIDCLIKDDYEMQYFPDLYEAPLMIFITGWLIQRVQMGGLLGNIFRFFDRKEILFNILLNYSIRIQEDWVKAYYKRIGEEYIPFFS